MQTGFLAHWLFAIICMFVMSVRPPVPARAVEVEPPKIATPAVPVRLAAAAKPRVTVVGPVVVTASKIEEPLSNVASSLTLITREDIERRRAQTIQEVLREVPGVDLQSNGGSPGSFTQVRIRGANDDNVVVLVDGARVNGLFGGNFDFGLMPTDNVERIEVLRGGASALYGSDAIGGVINIITRRGKGKPRVSLFWEGGSLETFKEGASATGVWKGNDFAITYSRLDSTGLRPGPFNHSHERANHWSILLGRDLGPEDDRLGRVQSTLNVSQEDLQVPFDFPFGFDFFAAPFGDPAAFETYDPNNNQRRLFVTTTNTLDLKPTDWWETTLRFSLTQNRLRSDNELDQGLPFPFLFREQNFGSFVFRPVTNFNRSRTAETTVETEWLHHITFEGNHWKNVFTAGYLFERDHVAFRDFSTAANFGGLPPLYSSVSATRNRNASYYQDQITLWDRLFLNAGFRADQESQESNRILPGTTMRTHSKTDSLYGIEYTPRFSAALDLPEIHAKLHGAWSRNFHAPTFADLYFPGFSNDMLQPEISRSAEGGVTMNFLDGRLGGDVTYYRTDFDGLIVFVTLAGPPFFDLANVAKAKAEGLEVSGWAGPWKGFTVKGNYTFLDTRGDDGQPLLRRPRDKFNVSLGYQKNRLTVNLDFNYVGGQRDSFDFVAADGRIRAGAVPRYHRLDVAATWDLLRDRGPFKNLQIYTRIYNAFDSDIEQVKGFPDAGTTAFSGIRATF